MSISWLITSITGISWRLDEVITRGPVYETLFRVLKIMSISWVTGFVFVFNPIDIYGGEMLSIYTFVDINSMAIKINTWWWIGSFTPEAIVRCTHCVIYKHDTLLFYFFFNWEAKWISKEKIRSISKWCR